MVVVRCAKHSIAIGFHLCKTGEGVNDAVSAVYCHWKKAPSIMIGDNNCKSHTYAMIREPIWWKYTVYVIDWLHSLGHKRCTPNYWISRFKDTSVLYRILNDMGAEQRNRHHNRIKRQSKYMKLSTFMFLQRLFLEIDNRKLHNKFRSMHCF